MTDLLSNGTYPHYVDDSTIFQHDKDAKFLI